MGTIPLGQFDWGSFKRKSPVSEYWGFDRGTPVDRFYIESFLNDHSPDIRGRVLEVMDGAYSEKFGEGKTTRIDILDKNDKNPTANLIADLNVSNALPVDSFDCIIFTQTLQLIYEVRNCLDSLYASLKTDGILLMTVPGITRICQRDWPDAWFWSFTSSSVRRLLLERFPESCVQVQAFGNILAATSFLHGLAAEELSPGDLEYKDPDYEVLITGYAVKRPRPG